MPLHGASWRFEPGGRARGGTYVALHHLRRRRARGALRVPGFGARSRESAVGRRPFRRPLGAHGGQAAGARARCAAVLAPSAPPPPPLPAARAPSPLHASGPGPSGHVWSGCRRRCRPAGNRTPLRPPPRPLRLPACAKAGARGAAARPLPQGGLAGPGAAAGRRGAIARHLTRTLHAWRV